MSVFVVHEYMIVAMTLLRWWWLILPVLHDNSNRGVVQSFNVVVIPSVSRNICCRRDRLLSYERRIIGNNYIYRSQQYSYDGGLYAFSSDDYSAEDEELSDEELEASVGQWDEKIARFNTIQLTGRVGNTPEARYFDDGKVVVNLSLASRRKYHGMERKLNSIKMGDEETDWYGLEIWGPTAEFVAKYVDKGARVGVVGQLQVDSWSDKATGEARNRAKVIVRDFDILETRAEADLRRTGARRGPSSDDDDDELYSTAGSGGFFSNN